MTKSKRSTASVTGTKKNDAKSRWFRPSVPKAELPEFDHLLNLYWGGTERRITGLTLRIIAVNAVALIMLLVGVLFLGEYQNSLIETKLETFKTEVELVSAAISEGAIENQGNTQNLNVSQAKQITARLGQTMGQRIVLFDQNKALLIDADYSIQDFEDDTFYTVQILKNMAGFIINLLPDKRILPTYPNIESTNAADYPDVLEALEGQIGISAWYNQEGVVFLSAAAPLYKNETIFGAALFTHEAQDIENEIGEVWMNILSIFAMTLILTVLLSIYLSGAITNPLRKLARAAESVRKGQAKYTDIPDLSQRNDEIGELSIALRQMTEALWDRMDSIDRFAADVSHELKNPLTSMRSAVETVSVVKKKADRDRLMDIIKHDFERLDRLITDISKASRLDAELSREELEKVNIKALFQNLLDVYKDPLKRKGEKNIEDAITTNGINIKLDCEEDDIQVWGIETRLGQVFENILSNALSFSPKKGEVVIRVVPKKRTVIITIEDQGPGIPDKKLKTIFERFYSERPKHETYGKHSGLGLSICQQILTALGGEIYAENMSTAKGARFTVILNRA